MTFKEKFYTMLGDVWCCGRSVALWPWPAVAVEWPKAKLNWDDYRAVTALIQPGDMLLMREDAFIVSNMAIPGKYKHLAVYTGTINGVRNKDGFIVPNVSMPESRPFDRTITHAISEGVVSQDLGEYFFECDVVAVIRPWTNLIQQKQIVDYTLGQIGKPYDFDFDETDQSEFYCTELGAYAIKMAEISPPPMAKVRGNPLAFVWKRAAWMKDAYVADKFVETYPLVVAVGK